MTADTVLWLVRHPAPEESIRGRCYGALDVGLSAEGLLHAQRIADGFADKPIAAVYSSPLQRCLQPARLLAGDARPLEIVDALSEMNFGELEGLDYDEIAQRYPEIYRDWMEQPTAVRFPGGESFSQMRCRVTAAVSVIRVKHAGQSVAMVTHGGVIRILLAEALGMEPANIFRIAQDHGAVNRIRYCGGVPIVELMNGR